MTIAKVFWSGHSQAIRLPKALRFPTGTKEISVERQGNKLILSPIPHREWPESFWQAFGGMPASFERPPHRRQQRETLDD